MNTRYSDYIFKIPLLTRITCWVHPAMSFCPYNLGNYKS